MTNRLWQRTLHIRYRWSNAQISKFSLHHVAQNNLARLPNCYKILKLEQFTSSTRKVVISSIFRIKLNKFFK